MPWIEQNSGGASITPVPVVPAPGATSATIEWPAVERAISYEVFTGPSLTGPWTSVDTTTDTEYELTGLTPETTTYASVTATVVSAHGAVSFVTAAAPDLQIKQVNIIPAAYGNGMLLGAGVAPPEGAISASTGRTYAGQFNVLSYNDANARTPVVNAVRFLLANLHDTPISGGKLIVGWSDDNPQIMGQGNSPTQVYNVPSIGGTQYNSVTGNARQGWKRATIGGSDLLPIPASVAGVEGAKWTDWIEFTALQLALNRLYWRFWHPGQVAGSDYALTYAYYDPNPAYGSGTHGTVQGDALRYDDGWKYAGGTEWDYPTVLMFDNSDLVTDPAAKTVSDAFVGRFSPSDWYVGEPKYVPPGPASRPWLAAEFREVIA